MATMQPEAKLNCLKPRITCRDELPVYMDDIQELNVQIRE